MTAPSSSTLIRWIFLGIAVWGISLSGAFLLDWSDHLRLWRALIMFLATTGFLASWLALLWRTGRLQ